MKKIVIKFGSSTLTNGSTKLSQPHMVDLARQICHLHEQGHEIVIVSSGAIAAGKQIFPSANQSEATKQMFASIGQVQLMHTWSELFAIYGVTIGQVLLTRGDLSNQKSRENAQNTFEALLSHRVIAIVNENDTIATDEIKVGDNDVLSAHVANLIQADLLIILTDQKGFYTSDPRHYPDAQLLETIDNIDEHLKSAGGTLAGGVGTGGMITKVQAAKLATEGGIEVVVTSAKESNVLIELLEGKKIGTFFTTQIKRPKPMKEYENL